MELFSPVVELFSVPSSSSSLLFNLLNVLPVPLLVEVGDEMLAVSVVLVGSQLHVVLPLNQAAREETVESFPRVLTQTVSHQISYS